MGYIEELVHGFERTVTLPWERTLAGPQKVWFVIYQPTEERRLRARFGSFELATKKAGYHWTHVDLTDAFAHWMATQEYRESYFECPEDVELFLPDFASVVGDTVRTALAEADENTLVVLSGMASLFGLTRVSELVQAVAPNIRGRLLVFFPGERDGNNYRLLDAREGWNYLALPISVHRAE